MHDPTEVPHTALNADTLRSLIEEFVTRDGTDYGLHEKSLDERVADVVRQIERGEVRILYDPDSGTANLAVRDPRRR